MNLFYSATIIQDQIILSEEESVHLKKVMRKGIGDFVHVTDGLGKLYKSEIIEYASKKCILHIIEEILANPGNQVKLHIGIAPTKNHDRLEWFVEKATEIGISEITPLLCDHSERNKVNKERLLRIMVAAMKQSNRLFLPSLNEEMRLDPFLEKNSGADKFIAHCDSGEKKLLIDVMVPGQDTLILIGPEGDFSEQEISIALKSDCIPVSLGNARYRTETAGLMACSTFALANRDQSTKV